MNERDPMNDQEERGPERDSMQEQESFSGSSPCAFCGVMSDRGRELCSGCGTMLPPIEGGIPWEKRRDLGFVTALFETVSGALRSPTQFFARTRGERRHGGALLFVITMDFFATLVATIWTLSLSADAARENMTSMIETVLRLQIAPEMMEQIFKFAMIGEVLLAPIISLITVYCTAGIVYLMMAVLVIEGRRFSLVLSLIALAHTAQVAFLLPEIGGLIAGILGVIFIMIALAARFKLSWGKAAILALSPSFAGALFIILAGGLLFGSVG